MYEQLKATWNTLNALAWNLNLSPEDTQELLKRNQLLMLTYMDLMVAQVKPPSQPPTGQAVNSAANGHKPAPTHA